MPIITQYGEFEEVIPWNHYPTVKPTDLMLYLIRMVTPKGGTTLDPFMGSGSTDKASVRDTFKKVEGFINNIEWSEETRSSPKMQQVLPNLYLEPIQIEEESTQPVQVDMAKLKKAIKRRKRIKKE